MLRRDLLKLAALSSLPVPFGGTFAAAASETPRSGGTLVVAVQNDAKSLDPTYRINFSEGPPLYLIFNSLVGLAPDFTIIPELAERWETASDGKTLTLFLRGGVKFHDGTAFDAKVAKWNIERRLDEKVNSPSRPQLLEMIAGVETPSDTTLVLHLKGPSPSLLDLLAQREGFMISPTAMEKYGADFGQHPVGTGPFIFKSWTQGQQIVVEKNPNYWEPGKPYLDRVTIMLMANSAVGVPRLLTRELDFVSALTPVDIRTLSQAKDLVLSPSPGSRWMSLQMRVDRPPFDNLKLRQAMAYAIDRKRMVEIIMDGKAPIAEGFVPPGLWWFDPNLKSYPHDPDKAKALVSEIGALAETELQLATQPVPIYQQVSQLAQEAMRAVGLKVTIVPVSMNDWYPLLIKGATNFLPIRWTQRPDPDGLFTYLFESKSSGNSCHYSNPEVDKLLAEARSISDQSARASLYFKAQELITHDLPYIPLFFSIEFAAMQSNVRNYVWIADEVPRFREVWKAA
ncbi:MAG TPA: ABC transporter substrate-binding protein [Stellaceae bacterium]|nr:ABC transporter substrate-binding protein [Stellaceae bacterium]